MSTATLSFGLLDAPTEIRSALREIDPDADLVHLGGREWLLGVRRPNAAAEQRVREQLTQLTTTKLEVSERAERALAESQLGKELQLLQFFASAPFRPIHLYEIGGEGGTSFGAVVRDFRLRDFNWRTRREAAFRELKDAVSFDLADQKRTGLVREFIRQESRSMFRFVMKKARSFLQRAAIHQGA